MGCVVCFAPHRVSGLSVRECGAIGCYPLLCLPHSPALSVYLRECGAAGSASGQTACPVCPTLCQSGSRHSNASPLRPGCPSPPLLPVWMNVYFLFPWCQTSLPFDFLSVLVVRGGTVCLPTPPSWFSPLSPSLVRITLCRKLGDRCRVSDATIFISSFLWSQPTCNGTNFSCCTGSRTVDVLVAQISQVTGQW